MAYDERLAGRVRDLLSGQVEAEKKVSGGLAFMVEGRIGREPGTEAGRFARRRRGTSVTSDGPSESGRLGS